MTPRLVSVEEAKDMFELAITDAIAQILHGEIPLQPVDMWRVEQRATCPCRARHLLVFQVRGWGAADAKFRRGELKCPRCKGRLVAEAKKSLIVTP